MPPTTSLGNSHISHSRRRRYTAGSVDRAVKMSTLCLLSGPSRKHTCSRFTLHIIRMRRHHSQVIFYVSHLRLRTGLQQKASLPFYRLDVASNAKNAFLLALLGMGERGRMTRARHRLECLHPDQGINALCSLNRDSIFFTLQHVAAVPRH